MQALELLLNFCVWTFAGWLWSAILLGLFESGRPTAECPTEEERKAIGRRGGLFALGSGLLLALAHLVFVDLPLLQHLD
jgi:hypothetical protein